MNRKILTVALSMSLIFLQAIPAFAENPDTVGTEVVVEQVSSDVDESASVLAETEEISFTDDVEGESEEDIFEHGDSVMQEDKTMLIKEGKTSMQAYAAGDSISNATSISTGTTYSESITASNKVDYYKFVINSSGRVTLTATAGMTWIYYYIYDSSGNQLWQINPRWNNTTELISTSETLDLTKGTYYFAVKEDGSTGSYSFKLDFNSAGESFTETGSGSNNAINSANTINVNTSYHGQIAKNDDKDFYQFTLSSSGRIAISATAKMEWIYYYVYDSSGNELWKRNPRWNSTTETITTSEIVDLTKGTYYFVVSRDSYNTGNYSFKLGYTNANESFSEEGFGSNNEITSANSISLNTSYNGQIAINDEKDFYKFTLRNAAKIYFTATAQMEWIYYYIYDSTGNQLWSRNPRWNSVTEKISTFETVDLSAGTYYFSFKRDGSYTGVYTFEIATRPPLNTDNCSHSYEITNISATFAAKGYQLHKCKKCGYSYKDHYTEKRQLSVPYMYVIQSGKKKVTVNWSGVSYASGYQISCKCGNTTKTYQVKKASVSRKTIKKLKPKKKCVFRVRAYRKEGGVTVYSKWSKKKSIRIR